MHFIKETRPKAPAKKKEDHTMKRPSSRVLSLLLALVLSFFFCPAALADFDPSDYSDLKEDYWAYDSIMYCSEWEIVKGYDDGKFYPENPVSGVEFVTMITRTFYADEVAAAQAEKPADAPWYWANVKAAGDAHVTDNTAAVNNTPMSRYDMAAVLNNVIDEKSVILRVSAVSYRKYSNGEIEKPLEGTWAYEAAKAAQQSIQDWDSVPDQYRGAVSMCYALGALSGMSDGTFSGTQSMTRAQACVVITRMKDLTEGKLPAWSSTSSEPQQPAQPETPSQPEPPQPDGSGLLANGQPATVENVQAILAEIEKEYPEGTSWGDSSVPGTNYYADAPTANSGARDVSIGVGKFGAISYKYACGGWMCMVSERIFGKTGAPTREVTDITKARPGDIVVIMSNDGWSVAHVCIFLGYEPARDEQYGDYTLHREPSLYTCDGNMGGEVFWDEIDGIGLRQLNEDLSDLRNSYGQKIHILTRYPD